MEVSPDVHKLAKIFNRASDEEDVKMKVTFHSDFHEIRQ